MYRKDKKNEFYTRKAKKEGYPARSVYKLKEIDDKYRIIKPGDFVYVPMTFISNLDVFWGTMSKYLMWWYGLGGNQPVQGNSWEWGGLGK